MKINNFELVFIRNDLGVKIKEVSDNFAMRGFCELLNEMSSDKYISYVVEQIAELSKGNVDSLEFMTNGDDTILTIYQQESYLKSEIFMNDDFEKIYNVLDTSEVISIIIHLHKVLMNG